MDEPSTARIDWIESRLGACVVGIDRIGAGASRACWRLVLDGHAPVVLREETGAGPMTGTTLDLAREAIVYRALARVDLPVPAALAVSDDGQALVLELAPGDAGLRGLGREAVDAISADLGRCLGRLHRIEPSDLDLGRIADERDLEVWTGIQRERVVDPASSVADLALEWCADRSDGPHAPSLCHGDAGAGNFLHDGTSVTALLDWEFAHLDDPHDDLAWVAVRNQVLRRPLDLASVFRAWRDTTSSAIDSARLERHRAVVLTRMLISCDATLSCATGDPPAVQATLRPYLGAAVVEALSRAGCPESSLAAHRAAAREQWSGSPAADLLDDPDDLDDLGGPW